MYLFCKYMHRYGNVWKIMGGMKRAFAALDTLNKKDYVLLKDVNFLDIVYR